MKRRIVECCALEARRLLAPLVNGQTQTGTIASGQTDSHTIDVAAGAPLLVAVHDASNAGFSPRVRVTGPGGSTVFDDSDPAGLSAIVPTAATGTYTIEVSAAAGAGDYTLVAYRPTVNTGEEDLTAAQSGRRFAKTVEPGDVDFFTLDATTGQSISATITENTVLDFDPRGSLIGPDGRVVMTRADEEGVRLEDRAGQDGRYFVVVTDDGENDTGTFGISITQVPGTQYAGDPDTAPLASGATRNGDLPGGDADVFQIPNVTAGDAIEATLSRTSGSLDPDIELYAPDGNPIVRGTRSNSNATSSLSATATMSGTYWVVARDFEADDGGMFSFRYDLTPDQNAGPIVNGVLRLDGTSGDDKITIVSSGDNLVVTNNGDIDSYPADDVSRIDLYSGDGSDVIDMRNSDVSAYVSAGSGDDTVLGGDGNDSLTGGGGRNRLFGGEGSDRLNGSNGRDFLYGEGDADRVYGQAGNDYLDGGGGTDRMYGGDGEDFLEGGSSNDRLYANAGNDRLQGGRGNDLLNGDTGTDVAQSREEGDVLISIESTT